jgi:signal transduction histidine kinase
MWQYTKRRHGSGNSGKQHIGLKVSVSPDMPSILFGDDVRIRQCIVNILKYSIANTFNGHVELESYCENGDDVNSVKLVFKVTDTSNGIKSNMIKHIFDSVLVVQRQMNRSLQTAAYQLL